MSRSWLEELEARLEAQLEDFLNANPRQEELLAEQEAQDRQRQLRQRRLQLQAEAEQSRRQLLELAEEIRCWQQRRDKASAAGAADLATRAAAHLAKLMEQGRRDWQGLTDLGQRFAEVEAALDGLSQGSAAAPSSAAPPQRPGSAGVNAALAGTAPAGTSNTQPPVDPAVELEAAWRSFETQQELEQLRQRLGA